MSKSHDDIIANITQAICGPLGTRSLAGALRKCLPLLLELRGDGIGWDRLTKLFEECGLVTTPEAIRRTVRREQERLARLVEPEEVDTDSTSPEGSTSSSTETIEPQQQQQLPGPGPPDQVAESSKSPKSANATILDTGSSHLDAMAQLKELNRS